MIAPLHRNASTQEILLCARRIFESEQRALLLYAIRDAVDDADRWRDVCQIFKSVMGIHVSLVQWQTDLSSNQSDRHDAVLAQVDEAMDRLTSVWAEGVA